ncbi:MAG: YbjN domain-containing protein [Gaiella sp.]
MSWSELALRLREQLGATPAEKLGANTLKITIPVSNGRTQLVFFTPMGQEGAWVEILTPVAQERDIDARTLLLQNLQVNVGAFALAENGMVHFRHALPLHGLPFGEFEDVVRTIADYADRVEQLATAGKDAF